MWIERSVGVSTRALGDAVPNCPEQLIAKRLLYDDSLLKLQRDETHARDLCLDLPVF